MTHTQISVERDVHSDLMFLKGHFRKKNMSDTIRRLMFHAGFREEFFEKMAELGKGRE